MAVNQCYDCFDDKLFNELGAGEQYNIEREKYDLDQHDKPFTCTGCGIKVNPKEF